VKTMQNLSGDVLQRVLQQLWSVWVNSSLPKRMFYGLVPNVSKDWRKACEAINVDICMSVPMWRDRGHPSGQVDYYELFKRFVQRFPAACTLDLRGEEVHWNIVKEMSSRIKLSMTDAWLDQAHALRLTKLWLQNCNVSWESVATLVNHSPHLTSLHLDALGEIHRFRNAGLPEVPDRVYIGFTFPMWQGNLAKQRERLCTAITSKYSTLTDLSISEAAWLNDEYTASLLRKLPNLERLNLAGIFWAWEFGPGAHPAQATMVAVAELTRLRALDLSAENPDVGVGLCDETFAGLSKCKNLELLCFGVRLPYTSDDEPTGWRHVLGFDRSRRYTDPRQVLLVQHSGEVRFENGRQIIAARTVSLIAVCRLLRSMPNLLIRHGDGATWRKKIGSCVEVEYNDQILRRIKSNRNDYFVHQSVEISL
jgi:hypothetical protein